MQSLLKRDREKRYQMLLEIVPKIVLLILLVVIAVVLAGAICFAIFGAPTAELKFTKQIAIDDYDYYNGTQYFEHVVTGIRYQNIEFKYVITLESNDTITGFSKDDVMMYADLYGRDADSQDWKLLHRSAKTQPKLYRRSLVCSQTDVFTSFFTPDGYETKTNQTKIYRCQAMTVFHERSLHYRQYKAVVSFANLGNLYERGLLTGQVVSQYQTTSRAWSAFEMGFRYSYAVFTFFFFIIFVVITSMCQKFKKWHTTQKWLAPLIFLSIWYHDPLYAAQVYTGTWIFPFISTIFKLAFIYGFLLYLLIFFHSLFKAPKDRTIIGFYLTKIVLVGSIYVLTNILLLWSRYYNAAEPAKYSISDVPGYKYLASIVIALLCLYAIDLLYYVFKAMGVIRSMRTKYSNRFWAIASFSGLVVLSFLGVLITNSGFRYTSQALGFLISHTIIFIYFAILSILFLPSWIEDVPTVRPTKEVTDQEAVPTEESPQSYDSAEARYAARQLTEVETKKVIAEDTPPRENALDSDQVRVTFKNYSYEDDEHL